MSKAWEYLAGGRVFETKEDAALFLVNTEVPMAAWAAMKALGIDGSDRLAAMRLSDVLDKHMDKTGKHELFLEAYTALGGHAIFTRLEDLPKEDDGVLGTRMVGVRILK